MKRYSFSSFFPYLLLLLLSNSPLTSYAGDDINLKKVTEAGERSEAVAESLSGLQSRPGETPLSSIIAIGRAISKGDWESATSFVDLRYLPKDIKAEDGPELLRKLTILWHKQNIIDLSLISDQPTGHLNDKLPTYRDLLGVLQTKEGPVPIYIQQVPDAKNGKVWKISNASIAKVPALWNEFGYSPQIEALANALPEFSLFHMDNWQLLLFSLSIIVLWFFARLVSMAAGLIAKRFESHLTGISQFSGRTLRWFVYLSSLQYVALSLGLSVRARVWFDNSTLLFIANTILALGLIELCSAYKCKQLDDQQKGYTVALLRPMIAIAKIMTVIAICLMWLENSGYDMSTILAGLGVGSLAIALAAQKPLENVFGALTLYAARPIKPGDFCRFGDTKGTVEEIGLRSTRVRKLDRSVVHIPNSVFSSKELENFSVIDRRRFKHDLRISLDTPKEQLQLLLIALRTVLMSHPRVLEVGQRARFLAIERDAFLIKINAYIDTGSVIEFFGIAEDLNFHILTILKDLDIHIAAAGQSVVIQQASQPDVEMQLSAAQTINQLIAAEELPFPNHSKEAHTELEGSISFPPLGSVTKPVEEETPIEGIRSAADVKAEDELIALSESVSDAEQAPGTK